MAHRNPQAAYAGLQKYLHQEWKFTQLPRQGTREEFTPVEKSIREEFLPHLLHGVEAKITGRAITRFSVKQAGTALTKPTYTTKVNWT